jgi:hypothetical protein
MMLKTTDISVECYSGYKADEYPKCFFFDGSRYEIKAIIDHWYQGDLNPDFPVSDYLKVETTEGQQFLLKHELQNDLWYLCQY